VFYGSPYVQEAFATAIRAGQHCTPADGVKVAAPLYRRAAIAMCQALERFEEAHKTATPMVGDEDLTEARSRIKIWTSKAERLEQGRYVFDQVTTSTRLEAALDLLEKLLALTEPALHGAIKLGSAERDEWQRISAVTADLRDGDPALVSPVVPQPKIEYPPHAKPEHIEAGGYAAVDQDGNGLEPLEGE
jgi:hypothetical protein